MTQDNYAEDFNDLLLQATSDIVTAYVGNNRVDATEIPQLIEQTFATLKTSVDGNTTPDNDNQENVDQFGLEIKDPAVSVGRSIKEDYLVCLEDGVRKTLLKRYIREKYGLSPDQYRQRWGLASDYPMVAPGYSKRKSDTAKGFGFGTKNVGRKNKK